MMATREAMDLADLKPFMRIVLDEMVDDPDPVKAGLQGTFVGFDGVNDLMMEWDDGRSLKLIEGVDKYHVIRDDELDKSFEQLRVIQDRLEAGESSRCPRCGQPFDCRRGAVSRRVNAMICPLCGQQEAIEDFLIHGKEMGAEVEVTVPEDKENKTGFEASEVKDGKRKLDVSVKSINDWYIVKIWQGREIDT